MPAVRIVVASLMLAIGFYAATLIRAYAQETPTWLDRLLATGEMRVILIHPNSGCEFILVFKGDDLKVEKNTARKCRGGRS
jgi:hypothetical protein